MLHIYIYEAIYYLNVYFLSLYLQVVTPQRLGNTFVYDVPQRASSPACSTDYDVPLSHGPRPAPRSTNMDYDHPPSNRPIPSRILDPVQQLHAQMLSLDHYDIPGSNRSSTVSMVSMGSNISAASSGSGQHSSMCESERSSLDLSGHDLYDVPPPARVIPSPAPRRLPPGINIESPMYDTPKSLRHARSKSVDLLDDNYDLLKPGTIERHSADGSQTYDTPRPSKPVSRNCSADSGISLPMKNIYDTPGMQTYDVPVPYVYRTTPPRRKSLDDNLDYDTPKSSAKVRDLFSMKDTGSSDASVYDVPPRVTKDMGDTLKQVEDEVKRVSSGSSDSDIGMCVYDELRMELNAAMESIVSLQHNLNSSCSRLLGFVHPAWRVADHLEPKVYAIKLAALAVKKSGEPFLEFAQGALANAANLEEKRLTKKLSSAVETLSESLTKYSDCLMRLNKDMWPLVHLVRSEDILASDPDDLDMIVQVTRDVPECVRSISGLIQGNSTVLFKRTGNSQLESASNTSTLKPKAKAPPPVKPKPRLSVGNGNGVPLAKFIPKVEDSAAEPAEGKRPLPTPPGDSTVGDKARDSSVDQMDYDVPKPHAKPVAGGDSPSLARRLSPEGANTADEYDYVSLTKEPSGKPGKPPCENTPGVELRDKENLTPVYAQVNKETGRKRMVKSLFPPPDVSTGSQFQERLEKLQRESEEQVKVHTEDYDVPQSPHPVERVRSNRASSTSHLTQNDRIILTFYARQVETHTTILVNAIETFLKSIEERQTPKTFVAYSKFVVLAAHKLVYIGDTLTRHLVHDNIRNDVMNHAYTLCELLKVTVTATKKAALEFPAVQPTQDMVDRVSEVSVAASTLRNFLSQFGS